jgi:hypothetical protein
MRGFLVVKRMAFRTAVRLDDQATCLDGAGHELVSSMAVDGKLGSQ